MTSLFRLESSFTRTIADLAPPLQSGEHLMPGSLYVLVSAMAGSIVTRNRNLFLRTTVPVAVGVGVAWTLLPYTMRNVSGFVWRVEERVPFVAENHLRVRRAVEEGWREVGANGKKVGEWSEGVVREGRDLVEGWVRKGK